MSNPLLNIDALNPEDRLRLIEELWESLSRDASAVPLTPAQHEELDRRLDDLELEGPVGIPWDEVLRQIRRPPGGRIGDEISRPAPTSG